MVDDDAIFLEVACEFLQTGWNLDIDTAVSASEGLKRLGEAHFDAIISDYEMPAMNGIDFLKKVRSRDERIPFILFTGKGREEVVIEAINNGADSYVQKGGDPSAQFAELAHKVVAALSGRRAMDSLDRRNEALKTFFDISLDLLCIANMKGYFIELNPQWASVLGYSLKELTSMPFMDLVHKDDVASTKDALAELSAQHPVVSFVNRYRCKDGTYRWLEWRSRPQGELIYATARDITEIMGEEVRLRHLNEVLRSIRAVNQLLVKEKNRERLLGKFCDSLVNNRGFTSAWMVTLNEEGKFESLHASGKTIPFGQLQSGLKKGEWPPCLQRTMRRNSLTVSETNHGDCANCHYANEKEGGVVMSKPVRMGSRLFGILTVSLPESIEFTSEEVSIFEEVVNDLAYGLDKMAGDHARDMTAKMLQESEQLFATAFLKVPVPMAVTRESDGLFLEVNESYVRLMGYRRSELMGKTAIEIGAWANADDRRLVVDELERTGSVHQRKVRVRTADASIVEVILMMESTRYHGVDCILSILELPSHAGDAPRPSGAQASGTNL
jgi:PAS domain S-box-containing protein